MMNIPETLPRNLFMAVLIVFASVGAGCISQQPEVLKVNPVIDYYPLEGFYNKSEGMFTVIRSSIPEVKESKSKGTYLLFMQLTSTLEKEWELQWHSRSPLQ